MKNADTTKKIPKDDWVHFDSMTEAQRNAAALRDPDAQPITSANIGRMKRTPQVKVIRRALGLSQEEFAERFHIPLGTLRDWEQSRKEPDAAARAYLKVIAHNPETVNDALQLVQKLKELLANLDSSSEPMDESEIFRKIRDLRNPELMDEPPFEWKAEAMAFNFCENCMEREGGWGTYFGPLVVLQKDDGSFSESPSIQHVNQKMIDYWTRRASESKNPLLRARYAGLVWDFSYKITGKQANYQIGRQYIADLLSVAEGDLHKHEVLVIKKLEKALAVATFLNADDLIANCKNSILAYENRIAVDDKAVWGFSFDLLLSNKKVVLSEEEQQRILKDLEDRLDRLSSASEEKSSDPWGSEAAVERLARYYRAQNRPDEIRRVLKKLQTAFENYAKEAAPLVVISFYERLHAIYVHYNLNEEAQSITKKIRQIGPDVNKDMKSISTKIEVGEDEFNAYIESVTEGGFEEAISRIAIHYIPKQNKLKNQLLDLSNKAPLQFLINRQLTDYRGRVVAVIGSLEDDMAGHIVNMMSQDMYFSSVFLDKVMVRLIERYGVTAENLVNSIYHAPVFREDKKQILEVGILAYLEGDYITSAHLLIPQIEDAIRNLIEGQGGVVLKRGRGGGFHLKTFDELLRDEIVERAFGEDGAAYLRVLFTDQRGWNLRNEVCHGVSPVDAFKKYMVDRILHSLLLVGQLREKERES